MAVCDVKVSTTTDVDDIKFVINIDYPNCSEDYVHRIGRTARSNKSGTAYTFFTSGNLKQANDLIDVLQEANQAVNPKLYDMADSSRGAGGRMRSRHRGFGLRNDFRGRRDDMRGGNRPRDNFGRSAPGDRDRMRDDRSRSGARQGDRRDMHNQMPHQNSYGSNFNSRGPQGLLGVPAPQGYPNNQGGHNAGMSNVYNKYPQPHASGNQMSSSGHMNANSHSSTGIKNNSSMYDGNVKAYDDAKAVGPVGYGNGMKSGPMYDNNMKSASMYSMKAPMYDATGKGGPVYDNTAKGAPMYENMKAVPAYENTKAGPIYDNTKGGSMYDNTKGGAMYSNKGGSMYDNAKGASMYDNAKGVSMYDNAKGGSMYNPKAAAMYENPEVDPMYDSMKGGLLGTGPPAGAKTPIPPGGMKSNQMMNSSSMNGYYQPPRV